MKSNLELLIEYFEQEKLRLEDELKEAIDEWDFEIAETIKRPLQFIYDKLSVLKNLENPNRDKIKNLEEALNRRVDFDDLPEDMFPNNEYKREWLKRRIQKENENRERIKIDLQLLKSIKPRELIDSDKLLNLLSQFKNKDVSSISFELFDASIYLVLAHKHEKVIISIQSINNETVDKYLTRGDHLKLKASGFNLLTYSKQIGKLELLNETALLTDISRIIFDVFSLYGDQTIELLIE